eukprot:CAMPEP_0197588210 /NCGR_PEP_ID=MMETSP1326-20131121/9574_1 /TAXON_ID=1155430 /ORGANISM="Genus nov. species nov., Strain RCC2288" /LENGTH=326 /DNA_ID=CAMNT_0043153013 /DNA_START=161 /DNA_END=1137 /DNA_ORIENTATION=+
MAPKAKSKTAAAAGSEKKKAMFDSDNDDSSDEEESESDSGSGSGDDDDDDDDDEEEEEEEKAVKGGKSKSGGVTAKGSSNSKGGGELDQLTINSKYAARFEHNKARDEMQRLQEKVKHEVILRPGDLGINEEDDDDDLSGDSDDDDESDDGVMPDKVEEQFASALLRIKRKDPALYRPDTELFSDMEETSSDDEDEDDEDEDEDEDDDGEEGKKTKKKKASKEKVPKKQTLRQVIATQLLEGGAEAFENLDNEGPAGPGYNGLGSAPKGGKSYVEEQADLKKAFLAAVPDSDSESGSDSDGSGSDSDKMRGGLVVKRRAEKFAKGA